MKLVESRWEAFEGLWTKFCGVADEYDTIKYRWMFMRDESQFLTLPRIDETLLRLDLVKGSCELIFKCYGFLRSDAGKSSRFCREIR